MNTGRIIVLVIALAAGGIAAFLASGSDKNSAPIAAAPPLATVDVLVAKNDIGLGQTVAAENLQWQTWTEQTSGGSFIRRKDRPEAMTEIVGSIARMAFIAGEPIREQKLVKANGSGYMAAILPSGMRAVSTEISAETGAGGFILPNDRVDVILSRRDREAERLTGIESLVAETLLSDVRVLAIDQNVEEKNGQKVVVGRTATLELTPGQAETLALSHQVGLLSLALRSIADGTQDNTDDSARQSVNVVRFGVSTTATPR